MPSAKEQAQRLAEMDKMTADENSDYYQAANAKELQREHLDLLEQANDPDTLDTTASAPTETFQQGTVAPEKHSSYSLADFDRMTADSDSDYYQAANARDLQRQHLALIETGNQAKPVPVPALMLHRLTPLVKPNNLQQKGI